MEKLLMTLMCSIALSTSMCALPDDDCPHSNWTYNFAWINRFLSVYY
jgi:hypothetical protein